MFHNIQLLLYPTFTVCYSHSNLALDFNVEGFLAPLPFWFALAAVVVVAAVEAAAAAAAPAISRVLSNSLSQFQPK